MSCHKAIGTITAVGCIDYSVLRFSGRRREVRVMRDTKPRGRMAGSGGPAGRGASAPQLRRYSSMESSAHPGSVAGRLFRNTMRRVLGNGRLVDNARL